MRCIQNQLHCNFFIHNLNLSFNMLALVSLFVTALAYSDPSACTGNKFYDPVRLECTACPGSTVRAKDFTYCNCSTTQYWNTDTIGFNNANSCKTLSGSVTINTSTDVTSLYAVDGSSNPTKTTCVNAYPDALNLRCIPCGSGMVYSTTLSACQCSAANTYALNGQCYSSTATFKYTSASGSDYLAEQHARVGCAQYGLIQSCNLLLNKCATSGYSFSSDFFCQFLATLTLNTSKGIPTYTFSSIITSSLSIYGSPVASTNTSTVKNTLNFILVEYNSDGSVNDVKPLDNSIFSCYLSGQDIVDLQSIGGVVTKACSPITKTFPTQYFYDVYVQNADKTYAEVPIMIGTSYYKRFSPQSYSQVTIMLTSVPPLQVPYIILTNTTGHAKSYSASSATTTSYFIFFVIFLVVAMLVFVFNFYRYMKYNPDENNDPYYCFKAIFLFLIYVIKYVAMSTHLSLLCFTTYLFCFYKFQQTVSMLVIDYGNDTTGLYQSFQSFFYLNFSFTFLAIVIFIFNLVNSTDYFMIDWEKQKELGKFQMGRNQKQVSIWRKVLMVNELYELSVGRIINIEMVSLFSLLFLSGLDWINFNQLVPNTSYNLKNDSGYYISPVLSYFIISFVIFVIALVQYILRHAIKIWWPLPIEDFVDLCSVSNISLIIFDEALHGYYIHGMNPLGQSQGSLAYIQSMFQKEAKAFGKSRSFKLDDVDQCQTFEVIFPFQIRQAFQIKYKSRFNQKLAGKSYNTSIISNPIPEMLNEQDYKDLEEITNSMLESFKYYLQGVKTSMLNVRERSFFQKIVNCPIDTTTMGKLPVFFKDQWLQFSNVLLSGHEFLLLFNFINFVNIFFIATSNIYYAFFIAFIFEKLFNLVYAFFIKRNISKNTLIDDKFFN